MRKTRPVASTIALAAVAATLIMGCSKEPESELAAAPTLPPGVGVPAKDTGEAAERPPAVGDLNSRKAPPAPRKLDTRVPTLVYDEMVDNLDMGWEKVVGPAWPEADPDGYPPWPDYDEGPNAYGDCASDKPALCKETYYGAWCRDECATEFGVIELITGDVCVLGWEKRDKYETDVRFCKEFLSE